MKSKRGARGKSQAPAYEAIDELSDEIDLIAVPDLPDEHLDEHLDSHLDEHLVENDDDLTDIPEHSDSLTEQEPSSKKRGRPKKGNL
jgi:hypothetical protein